jgi:hypothetical protein
MKQEADLAEQCKNTSNVQCRVAIASSAPSVKLLCSAAHCARVAPASLFRPREQQHSCTITASVAQAFLEYQDDVPCSSPTVLLTFFFVRLSVLTHSTESENHNVLYTQHASFSIRTSSLASVALAEATTRASSRCTHTSARTLHSVNDLQIHVYTMLYSSGRCGFTIELNTQPQSYIYWIGSDVFAHRILTQSQPSPALRVAKFTLLPASGKQTTNLHQHLPVKSAHLRYHHVYHQTPGDPFTHTHSRYNNTSEPYR